MRGGSRIYSWICTTHLREGIQGVDKLQLRVAAEGDHLVHLLQLQAVKRVHLLVSHVNGDTMATTKVTGTAMLERENKFAMVVSSHDPQLVL